MRDKGSGVLTLAKQSGITFIGNILGKALGFLFIMLITRIVTPSVYGVFTLSIAIVSFSQSIFGLNLDRSVDYFLPKQLSDGNFIRAKSTLITVTVVSLFFSLLGYAILLGNSTTLSDLFSEPSINTIMPIFGITIPLLTFNRILLSSFNSIKRLEFRVYTKNVIQPTVKLLSAIILIFLGMGIWGLLSAYVLALLSSILIGIYLLTSSQDWLKYPRFESVDIKQLASYSVPLMFAGVIYGTIGQVDYFVIGYFMASSDVGIYKVGYSLAGNLLIVLKAITPVFKPMVSERSDDMEVLRSQYRLATRWIIMATIPLAITLVAAPATYLSILFTSEYTAASTALAILVIGYILNASFGPEGMILEGLGYPRLTLLNTVILIAFNAALDILLVPKIGIVGAAIGTATGLTVTGLLGVIEIWYLEDLHPYSLHFVKPWLASIPAVGLGMFVSTVIETTLLLAAVLPMSVLLIYTGTLILMNGFTDDDRRVAEKIDEKLGIAVVERVILIGKS